MDVTSCVLDRDNLMSAQDPAQLPDLVFQLIDPGLSLLEFVEEV